MRLVYVFLFSFSIFSCRVTKQNALRNEIDPLNNVPAREISGTNGAVVSAHPVASRVGVYILKKGGNAVDAAIATQLALAVVYPNAGNIGGGGFLIARLSDKQTVALDYREKAPLTASRNMYLDKNGNPLSQNSTRGPLSSGVPGTVAGLFESLKYAKLPFDQLIEPAIFLAEHGFAITAREANSLNRLQEDLNTYNTVPNVFQRTAPWKEGDLLIQKDLCNTLKRIKEKGKKGFYEGKTARLIVAEMKRAGGYVSLEDLKNYEAKWRTPHLFNYKNHSIISMPPPSSGGILIHQMLKMIEQFPIAQYGPLSERSVQLMTEVERRAYADRAEYMGDPDFYKVPVKAITDSNYLLGRMSNFDTAVAGNSQLIRPGQISAHESEETTHISIIDKEGNAVAVTTTLNDSYGSRTVVGGAGFLLNDEMDDFSIKPGVPNMYGAVGGEANAIEPGKRMLSSMTPTIVLKNNNPYLVVGTPGGTTIPTSVFQTIVDIIEFDMSPREAIDLPKFHHQWLPDTIYTEKTFPDSTKLALENKGYKVTQRDNIGRTEVIRVNSDGTFDAAADKRGDDSAVGY
jgi:gamma-glutamyltranspeptidase/glutathione hydrolase